MTVNLSLTVNGALIDTQYFVASFVDHTVSGMVESLEGTGKIKDLDLFVDEDNVTLNLNGAIIPANAFVVKIIRSTMYGMVAPLKGVIGVPKTVEIKIKK
jgi:hypothetical protein